MVAMRTDLRFESGCGGSLRNFRHREDPFGLVRRLHHESNMATMSRGRLQ